MNAEKAKKIIYEEEQQKDNFMGARTEWDVDDPSFARGYIAALHGPEVKALVEALEKIAGEDYRGNRPQSSTTAYHALSQYREAVKK